MTRNIHRQGGIFLCCLLYSLAVAGAAPRWLDDRWRAESYPQNTHFTCFFSVETVAGEPQGKAIARLEKEAARKIAESIKVNVKSVQILFDESVQGNNTPNWFIETYQSMIKTSSDAEIVQLKTETYYNKRKKTLSVFAYAGKDEQIKYYKTTIRADMEEMNRLLHTAAQLEQQEKKVQARKQYETAAGLLLKAAGRQDVLFALGAGEASPAYAWAAMRDSINRALARVEITVFIDDREEIFGKPCTIVADRLGAALSKTGYRFTDDASTANYTLHIRTETRKMGNPTSTAAIVFCLADVTVELRDNRTRESVYRDERSSKSDNTTWESAAKDALDVAAKAIIENILNINF